MLTARPPITRVAILHEGVTYSLERPARHHDLISHIVRETGARMWRQAIPKASSTPKRASSCAASQQRTTRAGPVR